MVELCDREQAHTVPEGFAPLDSRAGFVRTCGGFYLHESRPILAMRIQPVHLNSLQIAHGGLLATLADCAFGAVVKRQIGGGGWPVTVSLSVDYLDRVREGEWLEAHVEVLKVGASFVNACCRLQVEKRLVLRANGIFTLWKDKPRRSS